MKYLYLSCIADSQDYFAQIVDENNNSVLEVNEEYCDIIGVNAKEEGGLVGQGLTLKIDLDTGKIIGFDKDKVLKKLKSVSDESTRVCVVVKKTL